MADRPPLARGQSDPLQTRSSTERRRSSSHGDQGLATSASSENIATAANDHSTHSSPGLSRQHSGEVRPPPRERHRVRFGSSPAIPEPIHQPVNSSQAKPKKSNFLHSRNSSGTGSNEEPGSGTQSPSATAEPPLIRDAIPEVLPFTSSKTADAPSIVPSQSLRSPQSIGTSTTDATDGVDEGHDEPPTNLHPYEMAAKSARSRAEQLSQSLASKGKKPAAPETEPNDSEASSPPPSPDLYARTPKLPHDLAAVIPPEKLSRRKYGIEDDTDSEDEHDEKTGEERKAGGRFRQLARAFLGLSSEKATKRRFTHLRAKEKTRLAESRLSSGQTTPEHEKDEHHVERPSKYRRGMLGMMLELYGENGVGAAVQHQQPSLEYYRQHKEPRSGASTPTHTPGGSPAASPPTSGQATPRPKVPKWHERSQASSVSSLIQSSTSLSALAAPGTARHAPEPIRRSSGPIEMVRGLGKKKHPHRDVTIPIHMQVEIQELTTRRQYIIKSCRALMKYGAPTHRLEEYMRRSARRLQLDGQFLYMPGCMVISFDSPDTRTAEVKIVRENQGVDLGKLLYMHDIYKAVIHGKWNAQEANFALDQLMAEKPLYNKYICIFFYGLASATVGPFGFGARPIDMPIAFVLGCILGFLQLVVSQRSESYLNVFEISAAVITSFAARGFGSIAGGSIFCFSALAQSAIALILPGFIVLSAALELQSRNMVAGSVRMVYAIIYSLFLGFGITVGLAFYGAMDSHAVRVVQCPTEGALDEYWKFIFVPIFTISLCIVNQAQLRQIPVMVFISLVGYVVNFFSAMRFSSNAQIANTFGALAVGLLGNLYSRLYQGMSAAAMLPAIFVQVPSGIAASGSLISGVTSAEQLLQSINGTNVTTVANGTQAGSGINVNDTVFNVGYTMIQIAVGLTVGLFFSSLVVYPFGKKRSGLFSF